MSEQQEPLSAERLAAIRERALSERPYLPGNQVVARVGLVDAWHDRVDLLADNARLRAALAATRPFLSELAAAHVSFVDDDDVIIKVSPGRAAWVIRRAQRLLADGGQEGGAG